MTFILAWMYAVTLASTCVYALFRGGRPERTGALICAAASVATAVVRWWLPSEWLPAAGAVLGIDLATGAAFFWLAISTIRFWPIWAFGFALSNVVASIAGVLLPKLQLFAFHSGLGAYAYLIMGAIILGVYRLPTSADFIIRNGSRRLWRQLTEDPPM